MANLEVTGSTFLVRICIFVQFGYTPKRIAPVRLALDSRCVHAGKCTSSQGYICQVQVSTGTVPVLGSHVD